MAGDWIKLAKCSQNKPEVMRLARLWGKDPDTALGAVVRFWIWLDDATVDGVVDGVASQDVDAMMNFPGFAMSLQSVGWLEIDDTRPCIRVPNFERHNGESAKKRALKSERQARWRANSVDAHVDAPASTREEKRRINTTSAPNEISFDAVAGWIGVVDDDRLQWAAAYPAIDLKTELAKARVWALSNPKNRKSNWRRFLTNWFARAQERAPGQGGGTRERRVAL